MGEIYTSIHTHSQDLFDSANDPNAFCDRMVSMHAKGFVLTQHGTMAGTVPMRKAAEAHGLKFVPGIEIYLERSGIRTHLILIAKDDTGYRALCRLVTEAQDKKGYAVTTLEQLKNAFGPDSKAHGHIFATSACVQGPCGVLLRQNEFVDKKIASLRAKSEKKYPAPPDPEVLNSLELQAAQCDAQIKEMIALRNGYKKTAETKFGQREKTIEKLRKKGDPSVDERIRQLAEDREKATKAAEMLDEVKGLIKTKRAEQTKIGRQIRDIQKIRTQYGILQDKIRTMERTKKSPETMYAEAKTEAGILNGIFGKDRFFIEIQYHGIPNEGIVYPQMVRIAHETGIRLVASNDIHIIDNSKTEILKRCVLRSMRFGKKFERPDPGDRELYIKSDKELTEWLECIIPEEDVVKAMHNTRVLFDSCDVKFNTEPHPPVFDREHADEILDERIEKGIRWRFPHGFPNPGYAKRLETEKHVIKSMGYSNYHLVVQDYLEYGRILSAVPVEELPKAPLDIEKARAWVRRNGWKTGIAVGVGRGSAVGSLVCYLLGITSLDPIKYGLFFERFLNPERVSMPDIDSDFAKNVRPYVIRYVEAKYGRDAVCGILTVNVLGPKGSIRAAAKYYGLWKCDDGSKYLPVGDALAKMVPETPGISFDTKISDNETLYQNLQNKITSGQEDPAVAIRIVTWAKAIEGSYTSYGAHAGGVVISDGTPIKDAMPLRWNDMLNEYTTQCDMVSTEEQGFLKMDFLGLKTLDIITECLRAIEDRYGKIIDPLSIPLDDDAVYSEIYSQAKTNAVFQCESSGMKEMIKSFGPTRFEDLIILVSMYRPGPMQYLDDVINVKHGRKELTYLAPQLAPILKDTYGAIVYQEQVMEIFQKLAGYTLGGADQVRRFMSKKKHDKLAHEREAFVHGDPDRNIPGCIANGIPKATADILFDQMTKFSAYAFNKSHAAAYAATSYWTAWLKYHYPSEFLMAALNWAENVDEYIGLINEARSFGIRILPPDVNTAEAGFSLDESGDIVFGLSSIKNVGAGGKTIVKDRQANGKYADFKDFISRVHINRKEVENMIRGGCFDAFSPNRQALCMIAENAAKAWKNMAGEQAALEELENRFEDLQSELNEAEEDPEGADIQALRKEAASCSEALEKQDLKTEDAKAAFRDACIIPSGIREDPIERMNRERICLGAYVTANPLDAYPEPEELGATPIGSLQQSGYASIMGIALSLKQTLTKKDARPMLFCDLEDRTGSVRTVVFPNTFEKYGQMIADGGVYVMKGKYTTEDGKLEFMPDTVIRPGVKKKPYLMVVESFALWHRDVREFTKRYAERQGHKLSVFDKSTGEIRELVFTVSSEVEDLDSVREFV